MSSLPLFLYIELPFQWISMHTAFPFRVLGKLVLYNSAWYGEPLAWIPDTIAGMSAERVRGHVGLRSSGHLVVAVTR